jgi:hypothetical protein
VSPHDIYPALIPVPNENFSFGSGELQLAEGAPPELGRACRPNMPTDMPRPGMAGSEVFLSLPDMEQEFPPQLDVFFRAVAGPGLKERARKAFEHGFQTRTDFELRFSRSILESSPKQRPHPREQRRREGESGEHGERRASVRLRGERAGSDGDKSSRTVPMSASALIGNGSTGRGVDVIADVGNSAVAARGGSTDRTFCPQSILHPSHRRRAKCPNNSDSYAH